MTALFLAGGALRPYLRRAMEADLRGVPEQSDVAVVRAVVQPSGNAYGNPSRPWALVEFRGRLLKVHSPYGVGYLREGGRARLFYRVGHSGRVHADRVEPLHRPPAAAAP